MVYNDDKYPPGGGGSTGGGGNPISKHKTKIIFAVILVAIVLSVAYQL